MSKQTLTDEDLANLLIDMSLRAADAIEQKLSDDIIAKCDYYSYLLVDSLCERGYNDESIFALLNKVSADNERNNK